MSYLVLTRKQSETLVIKAASGADEQSLLKQLRTTGIEVIVVGEAWHQGAERNRNSSH